MEPGQKVTIFGINWMAMTCRMEVTVRDVKEEGKLVCEERPKPRQRNRRIFGFDVLKPDGLVFEGWDLPISCDSAAFGSFRGNACLNMVGDFDLVRDYVRNRNLNPAFSRFDSVLLVTADLDGPEVCVFPDAPTSSAIVERVRLGSKSVGQNEPVVL